MNIAAVFRVYAEAPSSRGRAGEGRGLPDRVLIWANEDRVDLDIVVVLVEQALATLVRLALLFTDLDAWKERVGKIDICCNEPACEHDGVAVWKSYSRLYFI